MCRCPNMTTVQPSTSIAAIVKKLSKHVAYIQMLELKNDQNNTRLVEQLLKTPPVDCSGPLTVMWPFGLLLLHTVASQVRDFGGVHWRCLWIEHTEVILQSFYIQSMIQHIPIWSSRISCPRVVKLGWASRPCLMKRAPPPGAAYCNRRCGFENMWIFVQWCPMPGDQGSQYWSNSWGVGSEKNCKFWSEQTYYLT